MTKVLTFDDIDNITDVEELRGIIKEQATALSEFTELEEELLLLSEVDTIDDVENRLFENRIIYLHDEISQDSLSQISPFIDYYNAVDSDTPKEDRKPIYIKIGTYGGEAYEAIGIIDAIESSITPVHVHVEGKAMSAGIFIWASGHTRTMGKRSVLMYHQVRGAIEGTLEDMKRQIKNLKSLQKRVDDLIVENLGVDRQKLRELNKRNEDWYIDYDTAKKMNMIKGRG